MISHSKRFVFVHVPKAAGSSIEHALRQYSDTPVSFSEDGNAQLEGKHLTASELKAMLGADWSRYYSFGVVRNPWERVVSSFLYLQRINHPMTKGARTPHEWILSNSVWCYPAHYYLMIDEKLAVTDILRFETLHEDFARVCGEIGVEDAGLPHMNRTNGSCYTDYYDDESREAVARLFERDIFNFGYRFGK